MGTIYRWRNKVNGKGYTGKTEKTIEERERRRWHPSSKKDSKALKRAMAKYGKENFTLDIIEDGISSEFLNEREKYWIAYFDDFHNGYNLTAGGEGFSSGENHPFFGKKRPEMSGKNHPMHGKGHLVSGENNPNFGRKHTPEALAKMSGKNHPMYGKGYRQLGKNNPMYGRTGEKHPMFGRKAERHPTTRPEYSQARWHFFITLANMDVKEKRKQLYEMFQEVNKSTIWYWVRKWQAELES